MSQLKERIGLEGYQQMLATLDPVLLPQVQSLFA